MKNLSVLIKPASAMCNLRCKYCFYANISSLREVRCHGIMNRETTKNMIDNIYLDLEDGDSITFGFQGGEPTMAGLDYFREFIDLVNREHKDVQVHYSIQTNGTFINSEWCELFKKNKFLVGLSIDAYRANHDLNRVDDRQLPTFERVKKAKELFDKYKIDYNILTVLTQELSNYPDEVFDFILDENIKYIQFIPCLDDLDAVEKGQYALKPEGFSNFYERIFERWKREFENGNYISIKLIDDIYNLFRRGQANACGIVGNCGIQYVIESNGEVYPCDFYALDQYRLGNITKDKLSDMFNNDIAIEFLTSRGKSDLPETCLNCPYRNICRGGCKRMMDSMYVDQDGFCGYQNVLKLILPELDWITEKLITYK